MATQKELIDSAYKADDAWHNELVRVYGRKAGDARYDPERATATPELARLRKEYLAACALAYPTVKRESV